MADDKTKQAVDRRFVNCEEDYEINYLVDSLREEYGGASPEKIRRAIMEVCDETSERGREEFMRRVNEKLRK